MLRTRNGAKSISSVLSVSRNTVRRYVRTYQECGVSLEHLLTMHDEHLRDMFFGSKERVHTTTHKEVVLQELLPKYAKRLCRKDQTKAILYNEYRLQHPDGYSYSSFCVHLRRYLMQSKPVGRVGHKAAGKTTLFRLIMGQEQPDAGTFDVGETVKIAYVDQSHHDLLPEKTVYEVISQGVESFRMGGRDVNARAYLSKFNFSGADQEKKIGVLSGGERNRLHLAMTLKEEGNVLLLDEPTNDIDVNTLRALEEGLDDFAGCAVVVSHDRWFLDRICTHILSFEGDGNVVYYEGLYSDYEEYKREHNGGKEPTRRRYRKLME